MGTFIQIQLLLKLNKFTYKGIAFSYAYSNTTLVKVKFFLILLFWMFTGNSNTTLVKVKLK